MERIVKAAAAGKAEATFDLATQPLRELNRFLHDDVVAGAVKRVNVLNPDGAHNIAVGVDAPIEIHIDGHAGYYCAGMNKTAHVIVNGNVGPGVAEGMVSGMVHVDGFASVSAGAAGHGGLLVIEGDTSLRCGISMKGIDIVVGGSVGDFSAFMAQSGRLVICGDAGEALGDSLYEAVIFVDQCKAGSRPGGQPWPGRIHGGSLTSRGGGRIAVACRIHSRSEAIPARRVQTRVVSLECRRQSGILNNQPNRLCAVTIQPYVQ